MSDHKTSYLMPSGEASSEQLISKSRFIARVAHAEDKERAMSFINEVSTFHASAHHNAYAFIIGDPGGSSDTGYSDGGEVSGTAGKPILSILQHKGIGDVAAVVTRYYGGTKLGTGGLVRAYSGTLMLALDNLKLIERVAMITVTINIAYEFENPLRRLFERYGISFPEPEYSEQLTLTASFPEDKARDIESEIQNLTRGQARVEFNN